jgi:hypothetical protein
VILEPQVMTTRLRVVSGVTDPRAGVSTSTTFAVESGQPGVAEA